MPTTGSPDLEHAAQRETDLLDERRLELVDRRSERRLGAQQFAAHPGPLRP